MSTLKQIRAEQKVEADVLVGRACQGVALDLPLRQRLTYTHVEDLDGWDDAHLWAACYALQKAKRKTSNGRAGAVTCRLLRLQFHVKNRERRAAEDARRSARLAEAAERAAAGVAS